MTGNKKSMRIGVAGGAPVNFELRKNSRNSTALICGIISINSYSDSQLELLSHSGRIFVNGEHLELILLESRTLEIYGRITEVKFAYGKN